LILLVAALILVALIFDYINGFHDAANSIATVVSTRVLSPGKAVIWAAFFNFVAAFTFGTAVATTVGSGMVDISIVTFAVIFAGLIVPLPISSLGTTGADGLLARAGWRLCRAAVASWRGDYYGGWTRH
jgi:phosphate/sulfate permease